MNYKRIQQILKASDYEDKLQESNSEGVSNVVCKCGADLIETTGQRSER